MVYHITLLHYLYQVLQYYFPVQRVTTSYFMNPCQNQSICCYNISELHWYHSLLELWTDASLRFSLCLWQVIKPEEATGPSQRYINSRTVRPRTKGAWLSVDVTDTVTDWLAHRGKLTSQSHGSITLYLLNNIQGVKLNIWGVTWMNVSDFALHMI